MTSEQALVKVDWDSKRQPPFTRMRMLLQRAGYGIVWASLCKSPSGNGWHVVFALRPRPQSPYEVVALQAILGGDPWREAIQIQRAAAFPHVPRWMRDRWNVLYVKDKNRIRHLRLGKV